MSCAPGRIGSFMLLPFGIFSIFNNELYFTIVFYLTVEYELQPAER
jgi:hypothetical protein